MNLFYKPFMLLAILFHIIIKEISHLLFKTYRIKIPSEEVQCGIMFRQRIFTFEDHGEAIWQEDIDKHDEMPATGCGRTKLGTSYILY